MIEERNCKSLCCAFLCCIFNWQIISSPIHKSRDAISYNIIHPLLLHIAHNSLPGFERSYFWTVTSTYMILRLFKSYFSNSVRFHVKSRGYNKWADDQETRTREKSSEAEHLCLPCDVSLVKPEVARFRISLKMPYKLTTGSGIHKHASWNKAKQSAAIILGPEVLFCFVISYFPAEDNLKSRKYVLIWLSKNLHA